MKKRANWFSAREAEMSSSKFFRDDSSFTPVSLVSEKIQLDAAEKENQPPTQKTAQQPQDADTGKQSPPTAVTTPPPSPQPPLPDIDAIRAEAYEQGKQDALQGNKETEQTQQSELRQTIEAFTHACADVDNLHEEILEQSRGDMINLVIALSRKIIGREVATGRDVIANTLRKALELAMKNNAYDIWLNPDDLTTVEKMVPDLISSVQQLNHISLKTDQEILRGGCRLDSDTCTVDATIEAQLETMREFLEEKSTNSDNPPHGDTDTANPVEDQ